jgi:hypothetical protein
VKDELWKPQGERAEEDEKDDETEIEYRENVSRVEKIVKEEAGTGSCK